MITQADLQRWKQAKLLAVTNPNTDNETMVAMQEMYIELKALRRDNMKLLDAREVMEKMAEYIRISKEHHYMSDEMEEKYEEIEELCVNFSLELCK